MNAETAVCRAQIYGFLSLAFLYPQENWTEDGPVVDEIVRQLDFLEAFLAVPQVSLATLQAAHRAGFGAAGSLCYETEYGLPHEFRQSQEMADINGFYRAFGFQLGGPVRERPDHLAVQLEFMYLLALKEACAVQEGHAQHREICVNAQRRFLEGHLGRWIGLFAQSLLLNAHDSVYPALAHFAQHFVEADADRLGARIEQRRRVEIQHTPFDPEFSCADCALAGVVR